LAEKPKILLFAAEHGALPPALQSLEDELQFVAIADPGEALQLLSDDVFSGLLLLPDDAQSPTSLQPLIQTHWILKGMPEGVMLLNEDRQVAWANDRLHRWSVVDEPLGKNIYVCLGNPEILGPEYCPCHTAWESGRPCQSVLQVDEDTYYLLHAAPLQNASQQTTHLVVTVRDVTEQQQQQQKLAAIHLAGSGLTDLTPEEVFQMPVEDRVNLLKANILNYSQTVLNYEYVEIRLLDQKTGTLSPLLSAGIDQSAAERSLFAEMQDSGVTGFVAATGKSYLVEDTSEDPLYLPSFKHAKSSLTVPLLFRDHVIGTFNVESPAEQAFNESDLQFLELFARDVAVALHTLELLVAQKATAAQESVEAIHSAVALPVDQILNAAVFVMERYIGHEPEVVSRLQKILRNARDIKQLIHEVGQSMTPAEAVPEGMQVQQRPKLEAKRVLVVADDKSVRNDAHALLARYGCIVETATNGDEAIYLVRNAGQEQRYDTIISDIILPDTDGYELMLRLKELVDPVPLILMTGFGYDPDHSIVRARRQGLHPGAVLYKPFRLGQLLDTVELIMDWQPDSDEA
jgi:CheY-like chemotaxis protein